MDAERLVVDGDRELREVQLLEALRVAGPVAYGASTAIDVLQGAFAALALTLWAELVAPKTVTDASAITPSAPMKKRRAFM